MDIDVDFGDQETEVDATPEPPKDPDEFLAQSSFRIVYQTNNFFLPQIWEMKKKERRSIFARSINGG